MSNNTRLLFRCLIVMLRMLRVIMLDPKSSDARHGVDAAAQAMIATLMNEVKENGQPNPNTASSSDRTERAPV